LSRKKDYDSEDLDSEDIDKYLVEAAEWAARAPELTPVRWLKNYILFYSSHRKTMFTVLMIALIRNNIPMHPEAQFYKLPKEILLYIFQLLCESDGDRNYYSQ